MQQASGAPRSPATGLFICIFRNREEAPDSGSHQDYNIDIGQKNRSSLVLMKNVKTKKRGRFLIENSNFGVQNRKTSDLLLDFSGLSIDF
jgi:hypothetical protein